MKRKALMAVVGVFLLGLLGGALLGQSCSGRSWWGEWRHHFGEGKDHGHRAERGRGGGRGSSGRYIRMLQRELDLSEGQMAEIGPLLDQTRRDLYQARIRSLKEADQIILEFHGKITPALDEAQVRKLEELTGDFRERRRKRRERMISRRDSLGRGN